MITALILLDASNAGKNHVNTLLEDGQLLRAAGWLNTTWDDFSAQYLAREAGLDEVEWEMLSDDTGGTLKLTILYPLLTQAQIEQRMNAVTGIEDYELEFACYDIVSLFPMQ